METQTTQSPPSQQIIPLPIVLGLGALLLCLILGAGGGVYYFNGPCGTNRVKAASAAMDEQYRIYNDAFNIASQTSRIALAEPVAELQKIQRETEKVTVPACMEDAKTELVAMMETDVNAFLAFMGEASDAEVSVLMDKSTQHLKQYSDEMLAINECKPFCR